MIDKAEVDKFNLCFVAKILSILDKPFGVSLDSYQRALRSELAKKIREADGNVPIGRRTQDQEMRDRINSTWGLPVATLAVILTIGGLLIQS